MKLYLEIDIRPYLHMWKSKDNGTSNKKVMKKFYELFAQPSYVLGAQKNRLIETVHEAVLLITHSVWIWFGNKKNIFF